MTPGDKKKFPHLCNLKIRLEQVRINELLFAATDIEILLFDNTR